MGLLGEYKHGGMQQKRLAPESRTRVRVQFHHFMQNGAFSQSEILQVSWGAANHERFMSESY